MGQIAVGGLVLIACLSWPPLVVIIALAFAMRLLARAGRGSNFSALTAGVLILVMAIGLMYVLPNYAAIVLALGIATVAWVAVVRLRAANSRA